VGNVIQVDGTVAYIHNKVVALPRVDIEVGRPFADLQFRVLPTGIVQGEPRELDAGIGGKADGAAIFEFDFYASVILRADPGAL
jgi:hypothetical protein